MRFCSIEYSRTDFFFVKYQNPTFPLYIFGSFQFYAFPRTQTYQTQIFLVTGKNQIHQNNHFLHCWWFDENIFYYNWIENENLHLNQLFEQNFFPTRRLEIERYSAQVFLYSIEKYLVYIYNFVILKSPELQNSCGQKIFWFSHYQNHIYGFVKCLKILTSAGIFLYVSISLHVQIITVLSQVFIEKKLLKWWMNDYF